MSGLLTRAFRLTPNQLLYQQKRYRGKINIQKPRKPHYVRLLVDTFLTPYYENPDKGKPLTEVCDKSVKYFERPGIGPYEKIIARELRNWMEHSRMIAVFHRNWLHSEDELDLKIQLKRENMYYKVYGRAVVNEGLKDSPYTGIEPLMLAPTGFIFCPDMKVPALLKILKTFPQLVLIAGYLEGRLLTHDKFMDYGKLDLQSVQADLVSTLQKAGGNNLCRQLTHHQTTLTNVLKQISDQTNTTTTTATTTETTTATATTTTSTTVDEKE